MNGKSGCILIAEDDENTSALLALYLEREGFTVCQAGDGRQALELAARFDPSLIVLDLMLPEISGWDVCECLRRSSDVPILILSARQEEPDRLTGLSLGADDYVVKPFSPRELVARVKAILRRSNNVSEETSNVYEYKGLILDCDRHKVTVKGQVVNLTFSEFTLLQALMSVPGRVLTRQDLLDRLYPGKDAVVERVVDVHIGKLRQKLDVDSSLPQFIHTVRGVGYKLAERED